MHTNVSLITQGFKSENFVQYCAHIICVYTIETLIQLLTFFVPVFNRWSRDCAEDDTAEEKEAALDRTVVSWSLVMGIRTVFLKAHR